MHTWPPKK